MGGVKCNNRIEITDSYLVISLVILEIRKGSVGHC